jgi:hypothetical protein
VVHQYTSAEESNIGRAGIIAALKYTIYEMGLKYKTYICKRCALV